MAVMAEDKGMDKRRLGASTRGKAARAREHAISKDVTCSAPGSLLMGCIEDMEQRCNNDKLEG